MPETSPGELDLAFQAAYPLAETAALALEDYARALTRAREVEALRSADDPGMVRGVRVSGLSVALTPLLMSDIEDFARDMAQRSQNGSGLGWS